jgi:uncharacterized protein (DUF2336 family)
MSGNAMGRLHLQLPAMFALAHNRTESARVELAGMLADVFLTNEAHLSLREEELVNELIDQLLQTRTPAVRAQLIRKFANTARMPRKVAMSIVCDSIDIARDVLISNISLIDEDLITVIHTQSRDHASAVAQRKNISEAVADALIVTGDVHIMQMVAENLGAHLSTKAVDILADAARFTAGLRLIVMQRPEMTADAAARLYWWVSQDLRRYALKRFNIPAGQIDESLAKTVEELLGYHDLEKTNDETMIQVADWLQERQAVSVRILPQVLRLGHFRLFNILVGRLARLEVSLIDTIVSETGGRGLAVVCRAIGIDKSGFVSIFLLSRGARQGDQIVHPRELSYALAAFDRLSITLAQDLLRSWKADPSYLTNHAQDDVMLEA